MLFYHYDTDIYQHSMVSLILGTYYSCNVSVVTGIGCANDVSESIFCKSHYICTSINSTLILLHWSLFYPEAQNTWLVVNAGTTYFARECQILLFSEGILIRSDPFHMKQSEVWRSYLGEIERAFQIKMKPSYLTLRSHFLKY